MVFKECYHQHYINIIRFEISVFTTLRISIHQFIQCTFDEWNLNFRLKKSYPTYHIFP